MALSDHRNIQRAIWEGAIPIQVILSPNEVTAIDPPSPLFFLMPRNSYLHLILEECRSHFLSSAAETDEVWFESSAGPLKWAFPIGVLWDLCGDELPWKICVHFQSFPENILPRCRTIDTFRSFLTNSLKEALYLRFGSTKGAAALGKSDYQQWWTSVTTYSFDGISWVRDLIGVVKLNASATSQEVHSFPVRLLFRGFSELSVPASAQSYVEWPVPIDMTMTVGQYLNAMLPELQRDYVYVAAPSSSSSSSSSSAVVMAEALRAASSSSSSVLPPASPSPAPASPAASASASGSSSASAEACSSSSASSSSSPSSSSSSSAAESSSLISESKDCVVGPASSSSSSSSSGSCSVSAPSSSSSAAVAAESASASAIASAPSVSVSVSTPAAAATATATSAKGGFYVLIHGISIPIDTPMFWLWENFGFADLFLWMIVSKATCTCSADSAAASKK